MGQPLFRPQTFCSVVIYKAQTEAYFQVMKLFICESSVVFLVLHSDMFAYAGAEEHMLIK